MSANEARTVLWWGRFDPAYSRNRILRCAYADLGWRVVDFRPAISAIGDIEAALRRLPPVDLIHVPCFRQRDMAAALRHARRRSLPLLFDPLISAWDKQVFERGKYAAGSADAERLRKWEGRHFRSADVVLADTPAHAAFFAESFGLDPARVAVVPVGAEEDVFTPQPPAPFVGALEVLFYGSFLPLQGPEVIVEAAHRLRGRPIRFRLVGEGPMRAECERRAKGLDNLIFEGWLPYPELVDRIRHAHVVLGIFGSTPKAARVIPNKVYQAMACARTIISRTSSTLPSFPPPDTDRGIVQIAPANATLLAETLIRLSEYPDRLAVGGNAARREYGLYFSSASIRSALRSALARFG